MGFGAYIFWNGRMCFSYGISFEEVYKTALWA
jgi:hypothetical protein